MKVGWKPFTRPDGTTRREIEVSTEPDWVLFNQVAEALEVELGGQWTKRLDGLDQRYWHLVAGDGKITLHLEHYLGITLFPTDSAAASPESLALLERAYQVLEGFEPEPFLEDAS